MTAVANPQALEQAAEQIAYWIEHPLDFVRDEFNVELEPFQIDAILHFNDPKCQRVAMKACKGPGKTAVLAWCAWLFMATRPHTKVAATAISGDNLADNLWTEMAKWQDRSAFLTATFEWTKTRIFARDHPKTWWMSARQWSRTANKEQQANTLAGLHADFLLFILDESGSIPDSVMAAADAGLATGVETKIIQAGNPTELAGPLYRACTLERHLWHVIEITGDPADPNRCTRVSLKWAQEQIDRYGADNPWVLVNVFGKFPPASLNVLLGPDQVNEALGKHHSEDVYNKHAKILGVDPGRFGGARSVIFPRQGLASFMPVVMRPDRSKKDWTGTLAGRIAQVRLAPPSEPLRTDELWQTTCFEAFVEAAPGAGYYEFNLSPSTKWAAYHFTDYREGMALAELAPPAIITGANATHVDVDALIYLPANHEPWWLGLAVVIEETSGAKSYWALKHPAGKPDFHHDDGFALELA